MPCIPPMRIASRIQRPIAMGLQCGWFDRDSGGILGWFALPQQYFRYKRANNEKRIMYSGGGARFRAD